MDRRSLRADLRKRRDAFVSERNSSFITHSTLLDLLRSGRCVGSYVAIASEVDPIPLVDHVTSLALPFIATKDDVMTFRKWRDGDPLQSAALNFRQPLASALLTSPDVILTPLLGFDRSGNRLGQGAGHYDRYFASNPKALRIGLAWSVQEVVTLEAEPWDMPLDAIRTEAEWIVPPASRIAA